MPNGYYYAKKVGWKDEWMIVEVKDGGVYMFDWLPVCPPGDFIFGPIVEMP